MIPWTARRTNEEVLQRMKTGRELLQVVRKQQMKFLGHVMRKEAVGNLSVTGKIGESRARGRPKEKFMNGLLKPNGRIISKAADDEREEWFTMGAYGFRARNRG